MPVTSENTPRKSLLPAEGNDVFTLTLFHTEPPA
jgi:hypothetical protein